MSNAELDRKNELLQSCTRLVSSMGRLEKQMELAAQQVNQHIDPVKLDSIASYYDDVAFHIRNIQQRSSEDLKDVLVKPTIITIQNETTLTVPDRLNSLFEKNKDDMDKNLDATILQRFSEEQCSELIEERKKWYTEIMDAIKNVDQ